MAPHNQPSSSSHLPLLLLLLLLFLTTSYADTLQSPQTSFTRETGNDPSMANEFLSAHNKLRAEVNVQPLVWDEQLARYAQGWSDSLRTECRLKPSMGPYGENLCLGTGGNWQPSDAVDAWAREKAFYNPIDKTCASGRRCGHYAQIIWSTTLRLGCGRSECNNGNVIMGCSYDPPGNYVGPLRTTDP